MTLKDLGITQDQLPENIPVDRAVKDLPNDMTIRDLGYKTKELPTVRKEANKIFLQRNGPTYKNVTPSDIRPETRIDELPENLTLRELGLTEEQVPEKVCLDTTIKEMDSFALKDLGVQEEDIPHVVTCAKHYHQVAHGPLYWDVLPIELSPDTKLKELPQEMTLRDLEATSVPAGISMDTELKHLPENLTVRELGFEEADIPMMRQHANQNYQLRRGPVILTTSSSAHALPHTMTLAQIGV